MTLQTTTVAAQASVERKDMSVVTAVRNVGAKYTKYVSVPLIQNYFQFMRLFGGTLSLAVGSTLM
jgi:hypothetical protein